MRKIIFCLICAFLLVYNVSSQPEVFINNYSSDSLKSIKVKIYPISMVFNGEYEYNLRAKHPINYGNFQYFYIAGVGSYIIDTPQVHQIKYTEYIINRSGSLPRLIANHDNNSINAGCNFAFGFGKYLIQFWWANFNEPPNDYVTLEFDAGYRQPPILNADVNISYVDNNNDPRIEFAWGTDTVIRNTRDVQRKLECWNQYGLGTRPKLNGNFRYGAGSYDCLNNYSIIPQDPRRDCVPEVYPAFQFAQNHLFNFAYIVNYINYYGAADIGKLTLNLTVDKNITTPDSLTFLYGQDGYDPILPSPIVVSDGAALKLTKGFDDTERTIIFKKYVDLNSNTPLYIENSSILELQGSDDTLERSHIIFEELGFGMIKQYGLLMMRKNSKFTLQANSNLILKPNSGVAQYSDSWIEVLNGSTLTDCGARYTVYGPRIFVDGNNSRWLISNTCPEEGIPVYETVVDSGGALWLSNGGELKIDAGCKLTFNGSDSYLRADTDSKIIVGEGASIEFRNGAYLDADGCTFTSVNSGEIWEGILLEGAGSVTNIRNCTFNDAASSITVTNTVCNIANNTFNISNNSSCVYAINAVNETNITIAGNTFNAGSNSVAECIRFFNYEGDGLPGGGGSSAYNLNIYNNTFNGSVNAIDIQCLTASQLPFYIANNSFYPAGSITSNVIYAYNISGNIKNNYFYNSNGNKSITLQFSSVNLYNNALYSVNQNIWASNSTLMQMAPFLNEYGQWVWYGGYNRLNSGSLQNIEFRSYSNPTISPNGLNCFTVTTQPNFLGELCLGSKPYKAYDNYWSPAVSGSTFDITCNSNPVNVTYTPNLSTCSDIDPDGYTGSYITDLTNGIYDTVYITSGGEGGSYPGNFKKTTSNPDILYFEAIQKRKQRDYSGAINKCKELINEHDTSSYFNSAMSELYLNYLESDTSGNQTITNGLFNNLKTYIEQKMQQYPNNAQFVERAYKYHLMCLVKTKSYTEAIAGYENIITNHPDPIVRLNASWDRSAVVFMMGESGSRQGPLGVNRTSKLQGSFLGAENDNSIKSINSRNTKLLEKNPAHRIAKDIFREQKLQSEQIEKNITDEQLNNEDVSTIIYTKEEKQMLERRIENYNPTDKKDFMEKLSKDIKLIEQINTAKNNKKTNANVPSSFKLHQNYPNPFNPTTTIKYEIPKDAEITIKVYDLIGREVFRVNEYKKAGSYEVKFDGSNLATGMYIYQINSGMFSDSKKMVLIK